MENSGAQYPFPHRSLPLSPVPSRQFKSLPPNPANSPAISLLAKATHPSHLPQIHAHLVKTGAARNNFYVSKLLSLLLRFRCLADARRLLDHADRPNALLWNTLLKAYAHDGLFFEALSLYKQMLRSGVTPDFYTFPFVLKACEVLSIGCSIHSSIVKLGVETNLHVQNSLIAFYCKCFAIKLAQKMFDDMDERDLVSYTSMISGYAKVEDMERALLLFEAMPERDFVSWGAIISGFIQNGCPEEALFLFREMQLSGAPLSEVAIVSGISSCASLGLRSLGLWLHALMVRHGLEMSVFVGTALVDMYGKCGDLDNARRMFHLMTEKSVASWNALIGGLSANGCVEEALLVFEEMMRMGVKPNSVTLSCILSACRHGGLVKKGQYYFEYLSKEYGILLNLDHYGCMVDLLGRAGLVHEAYELICMMPMEPNEIVWGALLGACKVHKNLELAEQALKRLVELDPRNGGNYVLLSNMYAELGRWEDVERVRVMMRDHGVEKTRGCSSIEVDSVVHEFNSGLQSHPNASKSVQEV
uniref:Pentatricopeptide repeat-containing protein At2g20540 n=2 Tax=Elaeis guineensis var. tenera TaxID=51953 RepID=A0A6I9RRQ7_ELAGV|nr:pentatricopeptide repeat-containing protein At2g20540 [Elaeis guineensis]